MWHSAWLSCLLLSSAHGFQAAASTNAPSTAIARQRAASARLSISEIADFGVDVDGDFDDDVDFDVAGDAARCFATTRAPFLAIITEPDACDNEQRMEQTITAIRTALSTGLVDLISVRLQLPTQSDGHEVSTASHKEQSMDAFKERAVSLTRQMIELVSASGNNKHCRVVVSSDWVDVGVEAKAHGIHVKEKHFERLPQIKASFTYPPLIGMSTHSIESATRSFAKYDPDYYFCGTCYLSQTHPDKSADELEGPALPGQVKRALEQVCRDRDASSSHSDHVASPVKAPFVLGIGGIDATNCHDPVAKYGADGVAIIRAVLRAESPDEVVEAMKENMSKTVGRD
mmetsp:Transcript_19075/g.52982  ORF Transcript_19075/g.52982 Transcript_19075/m.52982 type:complete len:344 (-) Transcript_19075:1606-2637(-)